MCTLEEVEDAIAVLRENGCGEITILHCTTEYPAPKDQINLRAMPAMGEHFGLSFGYSDHTEGIEVPVAAVAMGARVIEKHLTLDKTMDGPDHKASLEPDEFALMVEKIRNIERALGCAEKTPGDAEQKNRAIARKSIVAKARHQSRRSILRRQHHGETTRYRYLCDAMARGLRYACNQRFRAR